MYIVNQIFSSNSNSFYLLHLFHKLWIEYNSEEGECDMIYRLLALNIDGTLLYNNGKIAKGLRETIEFVKRKDVYISSQYKITAGPRINIDYAEEAVHYPWRFYYEGHPFVSKK